MAVLIRSTSEAFIHVQNVLVFRLLLSIHLSSLSPSSTARNRCWFHRLPIWDGHETCRRFVIIPKGKHKQHASRQSKIFIHTDMGSNWRFLFVCLQLATHIFFVTSSVARARVNRDTHTHTCHASPHSLLGFLRRCASASARTRATTAKQKLTSYPDSLKWILNCPVIIISVPRKIVCVMRGMAGRPRRTISCAY